MNFEPTEFAHLTKFSPDEIGADFLLGVSPSLKPPPGNSTPSATRSVLYTALDTISTVYPNIRLLDLRHSYLPMFDGRIPTEMNNATVKEVYQAVARAGALYLAVPAYWRAVSGSFKNFIEVMCGANYGGKDGYVTVFNSKPIGFFVIGADEQSASDAAEQTQQILYAIGAKIAVRPVVAGNPSELPIDLQAFIQQVIAEAGQLVQLLLNHD
ncbi:MAG: NAD(P)H-dependent oxidoreductase [Symploca sp. SIO2E9]|nr:NAD(P)H-dependent oxidoreductase [Symploca sp. SIO2E9]